MSGIVADRDKIIVRTSIKGIAANIFLASFKAVVGLLSHSIAITLDAVNNLSDAGSAIITIIGTKLAGKQPDKKHPWGHGRIEYLSALFIAMIIAYAGVTSLIESIKKIISPSVPDYKLASIIIISVAIVVKIVLGTYVKKKGEQVRSQSLINSGKDAMMDAVISASTLAAAIIFILSGLSLEAWLGAVISLLIIKTGVEMLKDTVSELLGQRISAETSAEVRETLMSFPEVRGVYDLIFHDYGPDRINCSAHVEIPDTMTADEIALLQRQAAIKLFMEKNIVLTALGVYTDSSDERTIEVRDEVRRIVMDIQYVIQLHGFYLDKELKCMQFDIIVDFDAPNRNAVYDKAVAAVQERFPDHKLLVALDTDFSLTE